MDVRQAYNLWADRYDSDENKTRDLEAIALQKTLSEVSFRSCLEVGCGTGKNTQWLSSKADHVTAVDLSEGMLSRARRKISAQNVAFVQANISEPWGFVGDKRYDIITFSLILEHIRDLLFVFREAEKHLVPGGRIYVGELHPFKQYSGSKARFDTEQGQHIIRCYVHHLSDFTQSAIKAGLKIQDVSEFFDRDNVTGIPRILTLLLRKNVV